MSKTRRTFSLVFLNQTLNQALLCRIEHNEHVMSSQLKDWYSKKYDFPYDKLSIIREPETVICDIEV